MRREKEKHEETKIALIMKTEDLKRQYRLLREETNSDENISEDSDEFISDEENEVAWNDAKPKEKTFFIYDECCVCREEKPTIFNIPCGHVCMCAVCNTKNVGRNECAICRKVIKNFYVIKRS